MTRLSGKSPRNFRCVFFEKHCRVRSCDELAALVRVTSLSFVGFSRSLFFSPFFSFPPRMRVAYQAAGETGDYSNREVAGCDVVGGFLLVFSPFCSNTTSQKVFLRSFDDVSVCMALLVLHVAGKHQQCHFALGKIRRTRCDARNSLQQSLWVWMVLCASCSLFDWFFAGARF